MASKVFAVVGIALFIFVCLAMPIVSASYISHIPVRTVWGEQIGIFYLDGRFPRLECVVVSGDGFRDAMFEQNGVDPYFTSVLLGLVEPYDVYCGYNEQFVGVGNSVGVCYLNE